MNPIDAGNMQKDPDLLSMPLIPGIELKIDPASVYMNISCPDAVRKFERKGDREIARPYAGPRIKELITKMIYFYPCLWGGTSTVLLFFYL